MDRVLALSLDKPHWGCNKISDQLALEGIALSSVTVQGILKREERACKEAIPLTAEQFQQIEKANPSFAERHVECCCAPDASFRDFPQHAATDPSTR